MVPRRRANGLGVPLRLTGSKASELSRWILEPGTEMSWSLASMSECAEQRRSRRDSALSVEAEVSSHKLRAVAALG